MAKKKSWREKVNEIEEKIHVITPEWEKKYGKGKLLIPRASDIERLIKKTRVGQLLTNVPRRFLHQLCILLCTQKPRGDVTILQTYLSQTR